MTRILVYVVFTFLYNVVLGEDGFRFIPLSPLIIVSTMVVLKSCQKLRKNKNCYRKLHESIACYPNYTIHFTNPNATIYTHHTAVYDDSGITRDCNSSADAANYNIYFYCTTTTTVTAYFTDSAVEEDKLIRGNAMAYKIQCRTISPYIESLSDGLPVSIDEDVVTSTVKVDLTAGFYYYINREALQAAVGEQLFFSIEGPAEYSLKPVQCNASGGPETGHVVVITDGCSNALHLIRSFDNVISRGKVHHFARFFVFKFFDSDILTLTCRVRVCPGSGCNYTCTDRTKRALSPVEGSKTGDVTISTVSSTLWIVETAIGQSVHFRGSGSLILVLLIVVLLT